MITKENFKDLLVTLQFQPVEKIYQKYFSQFDAWLRVDFDQQQLLYPEDKGLIINERQTCNFSSKENFVVFECVHRLLEKGYRPEHIELEPKWKVGHGGSGGRADILIKDNSTNPLLIIECKTEGTEFNRAWQDTERDGGQLFTYAQQQRSTKYVCLYASDFDGQSVSYQSHIVALVDNEKLLDEYKDRNPLTYKDANDHKEIYKTWRETYDRDFATKGLFEADIQPYQIGKLLFTINDLAIIGNKDIQRKYHQFATILRQHNVSGRENAFDKLVNLFLCKIVDETNNASNLQFYWKGIAYDSFFELQDRLQKLYQEGMKRFLGEDVTYIDNSQIDSAFRYVKNDPDATRDTIHKYFRQLKFFTNNDFAFIDVHNEKLFYQNADVLLKIVRLFQDMRVQNDGQNQFLGDMFEGFLDQGVKQSEGQFFTPMPITKFIMLSLPLDKLIEDSKQPPRAIDYACGAGHFLNELALQLKPSVEKHRPNDDLNTYYQGVYGIEKEYRLSKVAKVSAFMYGQKDIRIVYADALAHNDQITEGTFSLLVANPPYSVKGFLETLSEVDRKRYTLYNTIDPKTLAKNNAIETFFIERAKQLLQPGGVAAIIVPSSILSNTKTLYVRTREILIQYFDIVAIAELGSGTFGKTGTNTVTLFLRRKEENPAPADHYRNRVDTWFKGRTDNNSLFADEDTIRSYCEHLDIEFDQYQTLLNGKPSDELLAYDLYVDYKRDFENLTDTKNLRKSSQFKALGPNEQQTVVDGRFLTYLRQIEKDKLYYYALAQTYQRPVVIIKSPSDGEDGEKKSKRIKQFLGYEWSGTKGNEGIKYLSSTRPKPKTKVEGEEEDEDVLILENLNNLENIQTALYDPKNQQNSKKLNYAVLQAFLGQSIGIPDELQPYLTTSSLADLIEFGQSEFTKEFSLTEAKTLEYDSKWHSERIGDLKVLLQRGKSTSYGNSPIQIIKSGQAKGYKNFDFSERFFARSNFDPEDRLLQKGDILINSTGVGTAGRVTYFELDGDFAVDTHITIFRVNEKIRSAYAAYFLCYAIGFKSIEALAKGSSGQIELTLKKIENMRIPVPPDIIQEQIINEIDQIDQERSNYLKPNMSSKEFDKLIQSMKADVMKKYLAPEDGSELDTISDE